MSEASDQHRAAATGKVAACAVLTVSDSRTAATDSGGDLIVEKLEAAGHRVVRRELVRDEPHDIGRLIGDWIRDEEVQVVLTTGGTGVSKRDGTVEVVERFLDQRLDGFGELFRMLSWQEVGSAAMLSRAVGGVARDTLFFCLPGSRAAVALALDKLILPELPHLLFERGR